MKSILPILLVLFAGFASAEQPAPLPLERCVSEAPFGFPSTKKENTQKICRSAYVLEHDNTAKIPIWVSYVLKPSDAVGCADRSNAFATDRSLPADGRSTSRDYSKSGYDQGHMANSGDMRWSADAEKESFIMSNMTPQLPGFNRGIWKELEDGIRNQSIARDSDLLIYVGSIYNRKKDKRIGANEVTVPNAFFKVVVDLKTNEVFAFLFDHNEAKGDPADRISSIAEIQRRAGVKLPLPRKRTLAKTYWPTALGLARSSKKEACSLK